jgi:alpha-L-fucosidase
VGVDGTWTVFYLPTTHKSELVNVIELTMPSEDVEVDNRQALDPETGVKNMSVRFASTDGCEMYKSNWMEKFGEWKHVYCVNKMRPESRVRWTLEFKDSGMYRIELNVRGTGKCVWKVESDEGRFVQNQQRASDLFADRPIGWLKIDKAGTHTISVSMLSGDEKTDLAAITITPVPFE